MPALALPLTFNNSFWSQDYRRGLETVYRKLEQGTAENDEVVAFIQARITAEYRIASDLSNPAPTGSPGTGLSADEGASLLAAFRGLQAESAKQGEAHRAIAKELESLVVTPFNEWTNDHKARLRNSRKTVLDGHLKAYEHAQGEVEKLKHAYLAKMRRADEAEDDAKFAPNNDLDKYTSSPKLGAARNGRIPQRTASISERIAQRFKEIQRKAVPGRPAEDDEVSLADIKSVSSIADSTDEKPLPKVDKGKGRAVGDATPSSPQPILASPPPLSPPMPPQKLGIKPPSSPDPPLPPPPILLAGLSFPPSAVSDLLKRAAAELPLRPVKFPILGEYPDCFSGEEFATWLVENVDGFGGSYDRVEDAAKDLAEREGVLRRVGEFGNEFENSDEAFYQFRPKAFNLHAEHSKPFAEKNSLLSPSSTFSPVNTLSPVADNLVKRSNTFINVVSKALNQNQSSEPLYVRARLEAEAADKTYRISVRKLDRQRLGLEERIEEVLKSLQRWESDRLRAVKTVLLQYQGTLANLPGALSASFDLSSNLIASFQPESDLKALMEQYRTGPFRPSPQIYESITHDEADVVFGIDLRKWADGGWEGVMSGEEAKDKIPDVVSALLTALESAYKKSSNDMEKRKTWIYEVPLPAVHHLRESINAVPPGSSISQEMLERFDAPVLANAFKLWLLELNPPICLWEGWEDIRRVYPTMGSKTEEVAGDQRIQDLQVALQRLPKVHLLVLDALISHLHNLIETTNVEEPNDIYVSKLALSLGRSILRPQYESEITVQDRHPTSLFIDLVQHYQAILPPTLEKKKRESIRKIPLRKRTAPIDMRVSRSRLSAVIDPQEILAAQLAAKNPGIRSSRPSSPARQLDGANMQPLVAPASLILTQAPAVAADTPAPPLVAPTPISAPSSIVIPVPDPDPVPEPPAPAKPKQASVMAPSPASHNLKQAEEDPDAPPPRPVFKDPISDSEDERPLPMPKFTEPPPEADEIAADAPSAPVVIVPPSPMARAKNDGNLSPSLSPGAQSPVLSSPGSATGEGANLSRSSSGEASRLRGPRGTRGPRSQATSGIGGTGASSVASKVAMLNRSSSPSGASLSRHSRLGSNQSSLGKINPKDYEPKKRGVGRTHASTFSRRTMASDAEEDIVSK